ncbi:MAG: hypothetical protein ACYCPT_12215 [Acidimicrobiales bacterium]
MATYTDMAFITPYINDITYLCNEAMNNNIQIDDEIKSEKIFKYILIEVVKLVHSNVRQERDQVLPTAAEMENIINDARTLLTLRVATVNRGGVLNDTSLV